MGDANSELNELKEAADKVNEVLVSATSVFPFMLFPDTVTVDKAKLTVVRRKFIQVQETISIHIEDVLNVECDTGPFFGSLKIMTRFFAGEPMTIEYLKKEDATEVKVILQGLIMAGKEEIDIKEIEKDKLIPKLKKLGEASDESQPYQ